MGHKFSLFSRDAQYFLEAAQSKSLSVAGRRIGLNQSSLSIALQRFEDELGYRLFERSPQGIHLTESGKHLYEFLQANQGRLAIELQLALGKETPYEVRVGAPAWVYEQILPVFKKWQDEKVLVRSFCRGSPELFQAVIDRRLDFALVNWETLPPSSLVAEEVGPSPAAVMGTRNAFPELKSVKTLSELSELSWIMITREPEPGWASNIDWAKQGYLVRDIATLRELVLEGRGITDVGTRYFSKKEQAGFWIRPDLSQAPDARIFIVYRPNPSTVFKNLISEFRKMSREVFSR